MKLIIILTILIVGVFSKFSINDDTPKQSKKLRKESVIEGLNLSGFHLTKIDNLKIDNNDSIISPNTKFNPKKVEKPESDFEKIGLVFTFENFDSKLSSIMFPTGKTNEYFIPYRFIKNNPQFLEKGGILNKSKSIELTLINDTNESFNLNIIFPTKLIGSYIESTEGMQLSSQINLRRAKSIKTIKESLLELKKRTNEIALKNSLINQSKGQIHDAAVEKKKLGEKILLLKGNSDLIDSNIIKNENQLKQLKSQLLEQEQNLESLKTQKISIKSELQSNDDLLKEITNNDSEEAYRKLLQNLRNAVEGEAKDMENIIKNLQLEMPDKSKRLTNLGKHLEGHEGVGILDQFLLTVTPKIDNNNNRKK